ncbi:radical SAM family enzyme [Bacillus sp. JCM 19046]|nr:radical SAM family enzyme [Bacillus sp. JCM 19045]GAF17973.1 radical SAM family enzyme [Bacillus sp. JCM 19046]
MSTSIYVHIPFCEHICHYCDFNKVFLENQPVEDYIDALIKEISVSKQAKNKVAIETIYIGGGTPTALTAAQLDRLFVAMHNLLNLQHVSEWTVEVNPDSADVEKLQVLKKHRVNRLSFGVQTFSQPLLTEIGRTHSPESVFSAIKTARDLGFTNLSVDLMLGLPNQTVQDFEQSLQTALQLDIEHISAYMLKVEKQTVFFNRYKKGTLRLPPEEDDVAMYELLKTKTAEQGLNQYEISNFGKAGYESKHNLVYWKNESYAGFGAGSSGYEEGIRYQNINPIQKYIDSINDSGKARLREHLVTTAEKLEEAVFLGLRIRKGLSKEAFKMKYGYELEELFLESIEEGLRKGLIVNTNKSLALTEEGLLLGNEAFELFVAVLEDDVFAETT